MGDEFGCWGYGETIASLNPNVTTFSDASVQAGTTYTYRVFSYAGGLSSNPWNAVTVTTP